MTIAPTVSDGGKQSELVPIAVVLKNLATGELFCTGTDEDKRQAAACFALAEPTPEPAPTPKAKPNEPDAFGALDLLLTEIEEGKAAKRAEEEWEERFEHFPGPSTPIHRVQGSHLKTGDIFEVVSIVRKMNNADGTNCNFVIVARPVDGDPDDLQWIWLANPVRVAMFEGSRFTWLHDACKQRWLDGRPTDIRYRIDDTDYARASLVFGDSWAGNRKIEFLGGLAGFDISAIDDLPF